MFSRYFRSGIAVGLAVCLVAPTQSFALAPRSNLNPLLNEMEEQADQRSAEKQKAMMPVDYLLEALELDRAANSSYELVSEQKTRGGVRYVRVRVRGPAGQGGWAKGIDVLRQELSDTREFILVYNELGDLICVLPILMRNRNPGWTDHHYLDLSAYYFPAISMDAPAARQHWEDFSRRWKKDQRIMEEAIPMAFENYGGFGISKEKTAPGLLPWYSLEEQGLSPVNEITWPFLFAQIPQTDPVSDGTEIPFEFFPFTPDQYDQVFSKIALDKPHAIVPVFPCVYFPDGMRRPRNTNSPVDFLYYTCIFPGWTGVEIGPGGDGLVLGPGSGFDTWLLWMRLGRPKRMYVIGKNPLEIANAQALGRMIGFEVIAEQRDHLRDAKIRPPFAGKKFRWIFWNMPRYKPRDDGPRRPTFRELWDGDVEGRVLKDFLRELPYVMTEDAKIVLWNALGSRQYDGIRDTWTDTVESSIKHAGFRVQVHPSNYGIGVFSLSLGKDRPAPLSPAELHPDQRLGSSL